MAIVAVKNEVHLVPTQRAVMMIEQCATMIGKARGLEDVKIAIAQAEAIAIVVRKIDASKKVQEDAAALLIMAEQQLGMISAALPKQTNGREGGQPRNLFIRPKREVLEEAGINVNRALKAERLAKVTPKKLAKAIDRAKHKTVHGVQVELGIKHVYAPTVWSRTKERRFAEELIEFIDKCCRNNRPPRRDEVNSFRLALAELKSVQKVN